MCEIMNRMPKFELRLLVFYQMKCLLYQQYISFKSMSEQLEQISFVSEQLDKVITDIIENILGPKLYDQKEVPRWINDINEALMAKLVDMQRPFKFLVNTMIMQRKGANVSIVHNNYWDGTFDQNVVVIWPKEKPGKSEQSKETIQCMVSVSALSCLNGMSYTKNEL